MQVYFSGASRGSTGSRGGFQLLPEVSRQRSLQGFPKAQGLREQRRNGYHAIEEQRTQLPQNGLPGQKTRGLQPLKRGGNPLTTRNSGSSSGGSVQIPEKKAKTLEVQRNEVVQKGHPLFRQFVQKAAQKVGLSPQQWNTEIDYWEAADKTMYKTYTLAFQPTVSEFQRTAVLEAMAKARSHRQHPFVGDEDGRYTYRLNASLVVPVNVLAGEQ